MLKILVVLGRQVFNTPLILIIPVCCNLLDQVISSLLPDTEKQDQLCT